MEVVIHSSALLVSFIVILYKEKTNKNTYNFKKPNKNLKTIKLKMTFIQSFTCVCVIIVRCDFMMPMNVKLT